MGWETRLYIRKWEKKNRKNSMVMMIEISLRNKFVGKNARKMVLWQTKKIAAG